MRFINADDIPWDMEGVGYIPVVTADVIEEMPTIGAIPIDWIKRRYPTSGVYGTEQYFRIAHAIYDLIDEWQAQNKVELSMTADERADVMNAVNDVFEHSGIKLQAVAYAEEGNSFTVICMRPLGYEEDSE